MGNPLTVLIYQSKRALYPLCAVDYYWGGGLPSTYNNLYDLTTVLRRRKVDKKDARTQLLNIIRTMEANGGGIFGGEHNEEESEWNAVKKMFPDKFFKGMNINSSCGVVSVTLEGIEDSVNNAITVAKVFIKEHVVNCSDIWDESITDFLDFSGESIDDVVLYPAFPEELNKIFGDVKWSDIKAVSDILNKPVPHYLKGCRVISFTNN